MEEFIKKLIKVEDNSIKKIELYTYHFPDGKWYIGFTTHGLEIAYKDDKYCEVSPTCQHLNTYPWIKPRLEKTFMGRTGDEKNINRVHPQIYEYQKEIIKELGINPKDLINKNLRI